MRTISKSTFNIILENPTIILPNISNMLNQDFLQYILKNGDQISATDFNGWILNEPFYVCNKYTLNIALRLDGALYFIFIDNNDENQEFKVSKRIIKKHLRNMYAKGFLLNMSNEPFAEYLPQFNLQLDIEKVDFMEYPLFNLNVQEDINNMNKQTQCINPSLMTDRMKRESMVTCPICKKLIAFDVDEALDIMSKNSSKSIDLICSWCGQAVTIDEDYFKKCNIIYKEVKQ